MEFNKKKCKALHLARNNAEHQYVLEADWLQQLSRKGSESPGRQQADRETVRSRSKGGQQTPGQHYDKHCQHVGGGDLSKLITCEATPGVLGLVLGSPVQERDGLTGLSPAKGHNSDEGFGASLTLGLVGEQVLYSLEERMPRVTLVMCING